jgi:hypothetical protein
MSLAFRRFAAHVKMGLMGAVVLLIVVVLLANRNNRATVWFFHRFEEINIVFLLVLTGVGSVAAAWVVGGFFRVLRELRRVRAETAAESKLATQQKLARELDEREKRIDEKLQSSLQREEPQS